MLCYSEPMSRKTYLAAAAAALVLVSAGPASAHIQLTAPRPRVSGLKTGPCGERDSTRSTNVCEFQPGATITVSWNETVDHPGHFRIAFDEDGDDGFANPTSFEDVSGGPGVLLDGIADRDVGGSDSGYQQQITLPAVECDNCTLQVIQVMTDKSPYGDGNDIYYQCADLVLSSTAPADPADGCSATGGSDDGSDDGAGDDVSTDDGAAEDSGGCALAGAGGSGPTWLLSLAGVALALRVRRRRR